MLTSYVKKHFNSGSKRSMTPHENQKHVESKQQIYENATDLQPQDRKSKSCGMNEELVEIDTNVQDISSNQQLAQSYVNGVVIGKFFNHTA